MKTKSRTVSEYILKTSKEMKTKKYEIFLFEDKVWPDIANIRIVRGCAFVLKLRVILALGIVRT